MIMLWHGDRHARESQPMRPLPALLAYCALLFHACGKDDAPAPSLESPANCGVSGFRLQATIGPDDFCANASHFADRAVVLTVNGIQTNGATLTLELDSTSVGTHAAGESINHVLYTDRLGLAWRSNDSDPANVAITGHDTGSNRIKGTVSGRLHAPVGGATRTISAAFELAYTE